MPIKKIYLDHSATTPLDKDVLKAMLPYLKKEFGNPSSLHDFGQRAAHAVDQARARVAKTLNVHSDEIIFTSGATESDNLAVFGSVRALQKKYRAVRLHIITTMIEHDAILMPFTALERDGIEVTFLPVDKNGVVDTDKVKAAIRDNTCLVSVMHVNNETGIVEPIFKIGKLVAEERSRREQAHLKAGLKDRGRLPLPIYFHTDATQSLNFFEIDIVRHHIDLLSLSGHKIYGPKGVGVLFLRKGVELDPLQLGGHQERGLRSGTYNTPGIVGLGAALEKAARSREKNFKYVKSLRDFLAKKIGQEIPNVILNTDLENSSPSIVNICFVGAEGEAILINLDYEGVAVSTGSACASGSLRPSHVLLAMGLKDEIAHSAIRFSLGKENTKDDINYTFLKLKKIIDRLRKMAPDLKLN